jgi:hypothetical protein
MSGRQTITSTGGQAARHARRLTTKVVSFARTIGKSKNPVHWEPLESPYTHVKNGVYKLLVKVRAAIILLFSPWFMKPSHFRTGSDSIYKGLGWSLPFIPGITSAWGATAFYGPSIQYHLSLFSLRIEDTIPHFSTLVLTMFSIENDIFIAAIIYIGAFFSFGFHSLMCGLGKNFGMRESPPPYEFFLVRTAGGFMWFSVVVSLMVLPVLAQTPGLIGHLAAGALSVPLISSIWAMLFLVAGFSWMVATGMLGTGRRERVHLKEMYESERFVKLVWRTRLTTLAVLMLTGIIYLIFLHLILSHHY